MEDNQKYNKRRRSYTEFRSSYSDNKDYFISTDVKSSRMPVLKYVIIAVAVIVFIFMGFIITDALLNISESPYKAVSTTEATAHTDIDKKYFENLVTTKPAENNEETTTSSYQEDEENQDESYNEDEENEEDNSDEDYDEDTDYDSDYDTDEDTE